MKVILSVNVDKQMCQLSVHVSFYLDVGRNVHHSDMKQVVFRRRIYKL